MPTATRRPPRPVTNRPAIARSVVPARASPFIAIIAAGVIEPSRRRSAAATAGAPSAQAWRYTITAW
jgi:hypothetical protein